MNRENKNNPWMSIPLSDYEGHMSMPDIQQAQMLADCFAKLLEEYSPESVAVIGCAGGNGFNAICKETTKRVVGIDINPEYLRQVSLRYSKSLKLELYEDDIQNFSSSLAPVDLTYAGLIFEYVDLERTFATLSRSICKPDGMLGAVLQLPSESISEVSPSPFTSLNKLSSIMKLVSPEDLKTVAKRFCFELISSEKICLPSTKAFEKLVFLNTAKQHG